MLRRCRCSLLLLLAVAAGGVAAAPPWPPLAGEVGGTVQWRSLAGAPPVTWRVQLTPPDRTGAGRATASLQAPGFNLRAEGTTAGKWQVTEGAMDLAAWLRPLLAAGAITAPADLTVEGMLRLAGEGAWTSGEATGRFQVTLDGGMAGSAAQGWDAAGINLTATFDLMPGGSLEIESLILRIATMQAAGIPVRDLTVELAGSVPGEVAVRRAEVAILGGTVRVRPFAVDSARREIRATVDLAGIALGEVAGLVPTALAAARGRLEGRIEVAWSEVTGFTPQGGALRVAADSPATIRLASTPGFLTQHLPERIKLLPDWLRLPPTWFAPVNPAYGTLQKIELGEQDLAVEQLRVELYPDGPTGARSATVEVAARPAAGSAVERVSFTVNVAGPLQQVLEIGLDERARLNFNAKPK